MVGVSAWGRRQQDLGWEKSAVGVEGSKGWQGFTLPGLLLDHMVD